MTPRSRIERPSSPPIRTERFVRKCARKPPTRAGVFNSSGRYIPSAKVRAGKVRPSDSWYADLAAVQELTDLEKITGGQLTCVFQETAQFAGRPCARVSFKGTVNGVGEDGPAKHDIDGHLWFDLTSQHLSYLSMTGTQYLLDKDGQPSGGRIEGTFVLTREPAPRTAELSDARLKGL